jgi:Killing trait
MVGNDNDQNASPPPGTRPRDDMYDELSLSGGSVAVALGILSLDAAHSLSLAMQNAVVEQQNSWAMQRIVMTKAMDQLLRNNAGDRAVDLLLHLFDRTDTKSA